MADPEKTPAEVSSQAGTSAPLPAPAVAEPVSSAVLPANEIAKPAEAAPVVAAEVAKPAEPGAHDTPTLLETVGDKKDEAKSAEAKPADKPAEAKPGEVKPEAKPAEAAKPEAEAKPVEPLKPAAVDYKYTIPETLKLDDTLKGELHSALDAFRANPAEGAQKLLDLHAKTMTDFVAAQDKRQREVFAETNKNWHNEILADPELGGSGYQTTQAAIARMRDMLVSPQDAAPRQWDDGSPRMSAFQEMCRVTGVGNHPVFWRMLHNVAKWLDEPQANNQPTEIRPPADIGRNPNKRRGAAILYTHPRSSPTSADN